MNHEIAQAILAHADATRLLAAAIEKLAGAGVGQTTVVASEPEAQPVKPAEVATAPPEPEAPKSAAETGPKKVKLSDPKKWTPMSPPEAREKCKMLITTLAKAGREQDIIRSLDSVDSSRLSDVPDLALASLFVALEVAVKESGLGE